MYFQLYNHCMFLAGADGGALYNLSTGEFTALEKEECAWLANAEKGEEIAETPFFRELTERQLGFFSEKPFYIDKIRESSFLTHLHRELKDYKIQIAILQLTGHCSQNRENCRDYFCPPCRQGEKKSRDMPPENWYSIIDTLSNAGATSFLLTGGNVLLYKGFYEVLKYLKKKDVSVSVLLPRLDPGHPQLFREHILLFPCAGDWEEKKKYHDVTVYCPETVPAKSVEAWRHQGYKILPVQLSSSPITESSMRPCTLERYEGRKHRDLCLSGKIYVDYAGNVIPCLQGYQYTCGSLIHDPFHLVFKRLIENYWDLPIRPHEKCGRCQWFYSCPSCRFTDVSAQCRVSFEAPDDTSPAPLLPMEYCAFTGGLRS